MQSIAFKRDRGLFTFGRPSYAKPEDQQTDFFA